MSDPTQAPSFAVIAGRQVHDALQGRVVELVELVEDVYRRHDAGETVNPPSYFLRFADRPSARIIALPASIAGNVRTDGIKWISSYPDNVTAGLPRASAVLVLNDQRTGYPFACMEASIVSATRTGASAALAADRLSRARGGGRPRRVGFIGTGLIARYVHACLSGIGWTFDEIGVHDINPDHAAGFCSYLRRTDGAAGRVVQHERVEELIRRCDLIVTATVASTPHIDQPAWFAHNPLVLHISLRDVSAEVVLAAANVVDDVEHCLKAGTSVHLTEQRVGHRAFLTGTLADVLAGRVRPPADRPVIFSPFGLGVLDLAVGRFVYDEVRRAGQLAVIENFFFDLNRYGDTPGRVEAHI
jgi:2,3-diaminopropionate biosynthesis protein SbnB